MSINKIIQSIETHCWKPCPILGKPIEYEEVAHIQSENHIIGSNIDWPLLMKHIKQTNEE